MCQSWKDVKSACLAPNVHGRSSRDVCWKESEYLKPSSVVSELYLLGRRDVDGSVETACVLLVK